MKRRTALLLLASAPLLFMGTVWQTSRYATLAADAKRIESSEEVWVDENEKLVGSISILSSRERINSLAGELGLEKASPERRIHIVPAKQTEAQPTVAQPTVAQPSLPAHSSLQARSSQPEGSFGG